jgi:eukaryotic-like serine/threonine-protein kinase
MPPGTFIDGRYEVRGFLGLGSYSEVYEVFDHNQHQVVALKLLDPTKSGPWPWQEAVQLTRLRSDFILPVWNAAIFSGIAYIVTELATNGTAERLVSVLPRPAPMAAVRLTRQAARGATRAHDDGVVHRDIKLENLFLDGKGGVRLGDFGLAHPLIGGFAPTGGTPATMAPEVMAGGPTSVASDVYSLGCCIYQLLTGWSPYLDRNPLDLAALHQMAATSAPTSVRDLAPHVSRALASRIDRALARDPSDRYGSAAEFDADLGRVPAPALNWQPVPTHAGHIGCWECAPPPGSALRVCVVMPSSGGGTDIEVARVGSNRRVAKLCRKNVQNRATLGALRAAFEALGN